MSDEPVYAVRVGPEHPRIIADINERFIVPTSAWVAFNHDLMTAMSAVSRQHGAAMIGGTITKRVDHEEAAP